MFNYDWFHGVPFKQQKEDARWRCALKHFPHVTRDKASEHADFEQFRSELEVHTFIYLRDGFSYEIKELADVEGKSHLTFECEASEEQYRVGSFVVTAPFEEVTRVESFAVHPTEKPSEWPQITGFRGTNIPPDRSS